MCFHCQATVDLEEIDKKRKEEFKTYEMEKELERRERLKALDELQREKERKHFEEMQKKHRDHPKVHHPVNRHVAILPSTQPEKLF